MKKYQSIIIANDAEAFTTIIEGIADKNCKTQKINKEHFLSSRFLFWEKDNKIVITPFEIERAVLDQLNNLGYINTICWTPKGKGINLCEEILRDTDLFIKLKNLISENPSITLSPYCYTKEFAQLIEMLREEHLIFTVDQEPQKKSAWLVDYLGSKIGFRIEIEKLKIKSPEFFICKSKKEIIAAGKWFLEQKKSFVAKVSQGEGGWGVLLVDNDTKIQEELDSDSIWEKEPFIVEEFIDSIPGDDNSPSVEVCINNKKVTVKYVCNQILDARGKFMGILMGQDCIDKKIQLKIHLIAKKIGKRYKELGYRGYFDIDFILSKDGELYPVETNVRRTGGTHVFDSARYIFGDKWFKETVCFSNDCFTYKGNILSSNEIFRKIKKLQMPMQQKREGVIITTIDTNSPVFAFIIFASTKVKAISIYKQLIKIFQ
ncbi:MAG: ATP-grasp domain-containing protein [Candidatus Taylorbacteria bacterium]|nr:ATP-grasp domain-containing protein [Candidatus Taylorbacteria bacterium]